MYIDFIRDWRLFISLYLNLILTCFDFVFLKLPQEFGSIRCIVPQTPGGFDGKLYFSTTNSAILEGSIQFKFKYVVQVIYTDKESKTKHVCGSFFLITLYLKYNAGLKNKG